TAPSTSPSRITSSPSHSPEHSPSPTPSPSPEPTPAHTTADVTQPSPTQPSPTQPSPTQPSPTQPSPTQPSPTQPSPTQPGTEHHLPTPMTHISMLIDVLEDDLRKTKTTYSFAITKLILKVKKLEARVKIGKTRRQARVVLSDDEDIADYSSKQGRKLSNVEDVTPTKVIQDQEGSEKGSDEVSTASAKKGTAT
ncbi:hypothetical protein Tco_0253990, partial [Tanacetum coccineum]